MVGGAVVSKKSEKTVHLRRVNSNSTGSGEGIDNDLYYQPEDRYKDETCRLS